MCFQFKDLILLLWDSLIGLLRDIRTVLTKVSASWNLDW